MKTNGRNFLKIMVFSLLILLSGCWLNPHQPSQTYETDEALYVMNGGGATLSIIDIERDTVYNNVALTGMWPNQILFLNDKLYCVNSGSNTIGIYDPVTFENESSIALGYGQNPMEMVVDADSMIAYVSCLMSDKVLKVNLNTKEVMDSIDVGNGPTGMAISNHKVYVTNTAVNDDYTYGQGTVSIVNMNDDQVVKTIHVNTNPQDIDVDADGLVHVLCTGDYWSEFASVCVIDPDHDSLIAQIEIGSSAGVLFIDRNTHRGFCGSWGTGIVRYDTDTFGDTLSFATRGANGIAVDTDGNYWVSEWDSDQVFKLNMHGTVIDSFQMGTGPQSIVYVNKE